MARQPFVDRAADTIGQRIASREQRLHINLGPVCNNNCIFCMEENRARRREVNAALTPERVRRLLEMEARSVTPSREVCFTSGEPTLVRELGSHCAHARSLGFPRISLMTNGRRLAHRPYLEHLIRAGVNRFYISIHGHQPKLHDALVRTPGAFVQTLAGLRNVAARQAAGSQLHTSTVVTRRNLAWIAEIYGFLRQAGADQVVFNVMQAQGRAHTHFDRIFPRYTDVAAQFAAFVAGHPHPPHAFLVDIPLCTTEGIPDYNRGYLERYVHFEVAGTQPAAGDEISGHPPRTADGEFFAIERAHLDAVARTKREACRSCRYDGQCEGVWRNYLKRFGWEEFVPVMAAGTGSRIL